MPLEVPLPVEACLYDCLAAETFRIFNFAKVPSWCALGAASRASPFLPLARRLAAAAAGHAAPKSAVPAPSWASTASDSDVLPTDWTPPPRISKGKGNKGAKGKRKGQSKRAPRVS